MYGVRINNQQSDKTVRIRTIIKSATYYKSVIYHFGTINAILYTITNKNHSHIIFTSEKMDRELTKAERTKARRKKIIPYIIGIVAVIIIFAVIMISLKASVNRDDLYDNDCRPWNNRDNSHGFRQCSPAFEEIINSPISTRIMEVYCKAGDGVDMCTPTPARPTERKKQSSTSSKTD